MIAIDFPWPSRDLHPNARVHWAKKAKATKAARADAGWAAKAAGVGKIDAKTLIVTATFAPPDRRLRDHDGMLSNIKAYLDGIADVTGVDDSQWEIAIRRAAPRRGGNVRIEIEVVPDHIATAAIKFRNERRIQHIDEVVDTVERQGKLRNQT
jgi:crossover junction endodeoxyribonuclease RusA